MASNDDITAAINSGESLAITPAQMVALLDRLIAEAVVDHKLTISYTVQGRSRTIGITDAQRLRDYYAREARIAVGMVAMPSEFVGE